MAGKIYLNNDLLWSDQSLVEPLSRSWNVPRMWQIPNSAVNNKENTIWIYVAKAAIQEANLGHVHIGVDQQLIPIYKNYQLRQQTLISIGFLINIIVGIFYLMVWVIYRKEVTYLWISLSVTFWVCYSSFFLLTSTPLTTLQLDRLLAWLFSTYTIVSCISIWRFANLKFPKIEKLLLSIFILATIILALVPNEYLKETIQAFFILNMIIFLLENTTYPFLAYKSKQIEVYLMAALHALFVPVSIHDAHQILTYQSEFWSPFISPFTALFLGVLLGLRLYRNNKVISTFNETLTSEIETVTQKLSSSLKSQYELALENIRLQERINLSRDLHDGIGGSIVRSIELVKRNKHIEKDNILSILKLLSSDLREIIDNGSSLDAQTPESPMLWAAPTRHRFMEIFDELNIQANWHLDNKWKNPPSPLQCLTLTRVIEETFTNIIKHSKATRVEVTLTETTQQLTLKIHDNGIGFNPNDVSESTHVGLQSMRMRVARIAGQFTVKSSEAGTEINVIFDI
jgi:signal transduction histidine kinase